mmetsp:Transcript_21631/g.43381  ORF Transcript_21631/g.43381 Transcript_21631/m.43381 type:complete len:505 (-) Transcript_21631:100-1614(-)
MLRGPPWTRYGATSGGEGPSRKNSGTPLSPRSSGTSSDPSTAGWTPGRSCACGGTSGRYVSFPACWYTLSLCDTIVMSESRPFFLSGGVRRAHRTNDSSLAPLRRARNVHTCTQIIWHLRHPEKLEDVEINISGVSGDHCYYADGSMDTEIMLQNLYVRSHRPGPDSIDFDDPTSVVTNRVARRSPCVRCGALFDPNDNAATACTFHAAADGSEGSYDVASATWSCCAAPGPHAGGCARAPHRGSDCLVSVRLETVPFSVNHVSLYKRLELLFYPGVDYIMEVQITKSLTDLFVSYFVGNEVKDDPYTTSLAKTDAEPCEEASLDTCSNKTLDTSSGRNVVEQTTTGEMVYVKELRVGKINMKVSTARFKLLNVADVKLQVSEYEKRRQIGTWTQHGLKFVLRHVLPDILMKRKARPSVDNVHATLPPPAPAHEDDGHRMLLLGGGDDGASAPGGAGPETYLVEETDQRALLFGGDPAPVRGGSRTSWTGVLRKARSKSERDPK